MERGLARGDRWARRAGDGDTGQKGGGARGEGEAAALGAKLGRCGWEKEKGEWAGLLGRGEKEKGKLSWVDAETKEVWAGLFSGLGWIAKGFGFPFSFLFLSPFLFQTNSN